MDKLDVFRSNLSRFNKETDISEYIDAINTANDIRDQILTSKREHTEMSDFVELQEKASILDEKLDKLSTNKELLIESINASKRKAKSSITYSIIGLIVSVLIGLFTNVLFNKTDDKKIVDQIEELSNIQNSLENLQNYVVEQKSLLENLNTDISSLRERKEQLEGILELDEGKVDLLLNELDNKKRGKRWIDILVSFLIGVFSSTTVALIFNYKKRRTSEPVFIDIVDTKGKPITIKN